MRPRQPIAQAGGSLDWRRSIKRHQRRWNPRDADDIGTPTLGDDGHHLDLVDTTTDGFFKAMNSRMHSLWTDASCLLGTRVIVTPPSQANKRSAVRKRFHISRCLALHA